MERHLSFTPTTGSNLLAALAREDDPQFMERIVDLFELQSVRSAIKLMN
jgi:hypothetical protein